jgi:OPA family glycerol-3-phosphate transporter-like MFS transporter
MGMLSTNPETRNWQSRVFAATWLAYFGYYFARKPFFIVKATLGEEFGWDAHMLGLLGTAFLVAYTLGQFVAAALGDRIGSRLLLLVGMGISILANLAFGFVNGWGMFCAFMIINGLAQGSGWAGSVGGIAPWFPRRVRGTMMGFWATNYQVGGVAANGLAAWALGSLGLRWSFTLGSLVMLATWAFVLFNHRNRPEDVGLPPLDEGEGEGSAEEENERGWSRDTLINVLIIGVFYFFVKFIRYALWSWAPYLLQTNYGLAGDEAGYLSTIFDLAGIGGVLAAGWLSDRYFGGRRARISFIFIVAMAASCAMLLTLGIDHLSLFAISIGLIGFSLYGPDALMTGAGAIDVGSTRRATLAAGIINGMGSIGSVAQEFIIGDILVDGDVGQVFGLLLLSSLFAAICLLGLIHRNRSGKAAA